MLAGEINLAVRLVKASHLYSNIPQMNQGK